MNEMLRPLQYLYLFQREAYISSSDGCVMIPATSVMFGIVRVCCGNFENKDIAIIGKHWSKL